MTNPVSWLFINDPPTVSRLRELSPRARQRLGRSFTLIGVALVALGVVLRVTTGQPVWPNIGVPLALLYLVAPRLVVTVLLRSRRGSAGN
jgi:hypothetical protein